MRTVVGVRSGAVALTYGSRSKDVGRVVLPGGMVPVWKLPTHRRIGRMHLCTWLIATKEARVVVETC